MKQVHEHEALDRILRYLIDNKSNLPINVHKVQKEVFPDQKQQTIFYLVKKKLLNQNDIITSVVRDDNLETFDVYIGANDLTEIFLNQGGFTGAFEKQQIQKTENDRLERLQNEKLEAEVDIVRFQKGLGKRLTIWGFIVGIISVLASVITTIIQNSTDDNQKSINSLIIKTDSLTNRVLEIEKRLEDKRDSTNNK